MNVKEFAQKLIDSGIPKEMISCRTSRKYGVVVSVCKGGKAKCSRVLCDENITRTMNWFNKVNCSKCCDTGTIEWSEEGTFDSKSCEVERWCYCNCSKGKELSSKDEKAIVSENGYGYVNGGY